MAAATPTTTIVPFASLPSCAVNCVPLYDANGYCTVQFNTEEAIDSCFCAFGALQPLKSGPNDVCAGACAADAQGLPGIQSWFTGLCNNVAAAPTTSDDPVTGSNISGSEKSSGGNWATTHTNWIAFIVVVVVAIIGIWTGACIWRRKYLKKKDRLYELGKGLPSTLAVNTEGNLVNSNARDSTLSNGQGLFMSGPGGSPVELQEKHRKWGRRS